MKKALTVIFSVLFIDIFTKIYIKTHFYIGESVYVFGLKWFQIHFIENNGMAWGLEIGGDYGKIFLSIIRILASIAIAWYLFSLIRKKSNSFLIITISLIFSGAIGNIVDSAFFGLIFSESTPYDIAVMFPESGGYASFLHGKVVDMFYFPLISTTLPEWVPFWGGEHFEFFQPVFNVADTSITIGVIILLIFQKRLFAEKKEINSNNIENEDPFKSTPTG